MAYRTCLPREFNQSGVWFRLNSSHYFCSYMPSALAVALPSQ